MNFLSSEMHHPVLGFFFSFIHVYEDWFARTLKIDVPENCFYIPVQRETNLAKFSLPF